MISVFGAFVLGEMPIIKMFGVGLSVAVFVDATVVRMIVVPAALSLMDRAAWWFPRWLNPIVPNVDIEGVSNSSTSSKPQTTASTPQTMPTTASSPTSEQPLKIEQPAPLLAQVEAATGASTRIAEITSAPTSNQVCCRQG